MANTLQYSEYLRNITMKCMKTRFHTINVVAASFVCNRWKMKKINDSSSVCKDGDDLNADIEQSCGIQVGCSRCRTRRFILPCCACGNTAICFAILLSIAALIQGFVVNGLISIIISTIEKRFHLQSYQTGFIAGCYDLGFLIAVPLVAYVGGRGNKPQWIGGGIFILGIGSITFALPHFIAPTHTVPNVFSYICSENATDIECGKSYLNVYQGFFILGQILHGIGGCGLYTLVITYIDANVNKTKTALYHGVFFACSIAGPGVGFMVGGSLIRLYTNLGGRIEIDESSPYWIGNWWLGFLLCGFLLVTISVPITFFPKELPNTEKYRLDREEEIQENVEALEAKGNESFGKRFRDVPRCLKVVLKNLTLVCLSIAGAMDSGSMVAVATFGPKFVEAIHRMPASSSGLYFGIGVIIAAFASHLLGGFIVSKFNPGIRSMIKFCIVCAALALCCALVFLLRCENPDVAGVNRPYPGNDMYKCQGTRGCSTEVYDPVCGVDDVTYVSLCDAGCSLTESKEMVNCTRIAGNGTINLQDATATPGKCEISTSCLPAGLQIAVGSFMVFFSFLKFQPALQVSLRTVPFHQRSFAIGIQWVIMRCFGLIPLPLILGSLLDKSCLLWEKVCGNDGSCRLYDNDVMSNSMTILLVCAKIASLCSLSVALVAYKPIAREDSITDAQKLWISDSGHRSCSNANAGTSSDETKVNGYHNEAFDHTQDAVTKEQSQPFSP